MLDFFTFDLLIYILIGFFAQIIDGAMSMAYGVISMTMLLTFGVSPAQASATVHVSEIFTTGFSGLSHAMFKNISLELFRRIVIPGVIGSILGAYLLTVMPTEIMKVLIAVYLASIGVYIFYKSLADESLMKRIRSFVTGKILRREELPNKGITSTVGFAGGFFDALGGGGWGAVVTGSLIAHGTAPRYTIGSTILAEFLVTLSSSMTFLLTIGIKDWSPILGLIIGGIFAAPLGAFFIKYFSPKIIMRMVSIFVVIISIRLIVSTWLSMTS